MKALLTWVVALFLTGATLNAQSSFTSGNDSLYTSINSAFANPSRVYQLELSHQHLNSDTLNLAVFKNLHKLTLSFDSLKALPKGMEKLEKLKILDISANNFRMLPEQLALIPNLEELYLNNEQFLDLNQGFTVINKITHLKRLHLDSIPNFKFPKHTRLNESIEYISMRYDGLNYIPNELSKFKHLRVLDVEGNPIKSLNRNFLKNKELESLTLSLDPKFDFKKSFAILAREQRLISLSISSSTFTELRGDFSVLTNIRTLSLHNDHLKVFPSSILELNNLRFLDLSGNDFTALPSTFIALSKLEKLDLSNDNFLNFDQTADVIRYLPSLQLVHVHDYDFTFNPQSYVAIKQNGTHIELFPGSTKNADLHIFKRLKPASTAVAVPFNNFNAEGFGIRLGLK